MTHSVLGPLPSRQAAVLDFIVQQIQDGRRFPAAITIARHMGWSQESSARNCLERLQWRGKVKRTIELETEFRDGRRVVKRKVTWELLDL